eukprot:TRINITY_DN39578_c0_g1_i1.p1 TRINITY_DN39578_c0_g1~~TRINITY_DN39578_c0_g1_i1.p1  ORF type:complete len:226 (+),score=46.00 TRINITY_DN39578_c0_g1_i1:67-678(+)
MAPNHVACDDVDWARIDGAQAEFELRNRRREQRYLADARLRLDAEGAPGGSSSRPGTQDFAMPMSRGSSALTVPRSALASSCSSSRAPPRTSSTSMSLLWRRAVSTPALKEPGGLAVVTKEQEEWQRASEHLAPEELSRLIEHVHARVLKERQRRKRLETELVGTQGNCASRGARGGSAGGAGGDAVTAAASVAPRAKAPGMP